MAASIPNTRCRITGASHPSLPLCLLSVCLLVLCPQSFLSSSSWFSLHLPVLCSSPPPHPLVLFHWLPAFPSSPPLCHPSVQALTDGPEPSARNQALLLIPGLHVTRRPINFTWTLWGHRMKPSTFFCYSSPLPTFFFGAFLVLIFSSTL